MFSSGCFVVSSLMFQSLIYFELIFFFEFYKLGVQFHCSVCVYPVFLAAFIEETLLSP